MKMQYKYIKFSSKKMLLCVFVVSILNVTLAFEKTFEIFTSKYYLTTTYFVITVKKLIHKLHSINFATFLTFPNTTNW